MIRLVVFCIELVMWRRILFLWGKLLDYNLLNIKLIDRKLSRCEVIVIID